MTRTAGEARRLIRSLVVWHSVLMASWIWARTPSIRFEPVTVDQGLSSDSAICVIQDRRGFIWLGTENGLNRFDGHQFRIYEYDENNPHSISNNEVYALAEDRHGYIWVGTSNGLNRFDPKTETFQRFYHDPENPQSVAGNKVRALLEDGAGNIWVGLQKAGLSRTSAEAPGVFVSFRQSSDPGGLRSDTIVALYQDSRDSVWLGTDDGLHQWRSEAQGFIRYGHDPENASSLSDNRVRRIYEDRQGALWVGTGMGLNRFNRETGSFARFLKPEEAPGYSKAKDWIEAIYEDREGRFWVGAFGGGLSLFDREANEWVHHYMPQTSRFSLGHHTISCLFEDASGAFWIGTGKNGFYRVNLAGLSFEGYRLTDVAEYNVSPRGRALLSDREGSLWIGSDQGLYKLNQEYDVKTRFQADSQNPYALANDDVWSLYEDRRGNIWVGTQGGLQRLSADDAVRGAARFQLFENEASEKKTVHAITEGQSGLFWVGTPSGLFRFEPEAGRFAPTSLIEEDSNAKIVSKILVDRKQQVWVGTLKGLVRYDPAAESYERYVYRTDDPYSLSDNNVSAIHEDGMGALWVGTRNGLNKYNPENDSFDRYGPNEGLENDWVWSLLSDSGNRLWVGSGNGLARFGPNSKSFRVYDVHDGLLSGQFEMGACVGRDGRLIFSSNDGLIAFYPEEIKERKQEPNTVVTDLLVYNKPVRHGEGERLKYEIGSMESLKLELSYKDDVFSFDFAALDYAAPQKIKYSYKLEGLSGEWTETDASKRFATYTNLNPGHFVFHVKAANPDGVEGPVTTIPIYIKPPIWRTWPAYLLYALLVVAAGHGYALRHRRKLARERTLNEQLDRKVAERTRALRDKNQEISDKKSLLERQAKQLERQARKLRELDELKSTFFTNISHELRTPLTLTIGLLEDTLSKSALDETSAQRVGGALRNARQLTKLVDDLLDLSKIDAQQMKLSLASAEIVGFLRSLVRGFAPWAERNDIALAFHANVETLMVCIDRAKMESIVSNLVANALKHTPAKGKVLVRLDRDLSSQRAVLSVRDTGDGIAAEALPYVFDRFYQAKNREDGQGAGVGIGLSLVKELTQLHGGAIQARSDPGFGSEFVVSLPLDDEQAGQGSTAEVEEISPGHLSLIDKFFPESVDAPDFPPPALDDNAPLVLVAEDHPEVRAYLCEHLGRRYRLLVAANGKEGLALARKHSPALILSDVMMPEMDGYELCRKIKANQKTSLLPVILLTAKASDESNVEGLSIGADDYIAKPFDMSMLITRIDNLIENRQRLKDTLKREYLIADSDEEVESPDQIFFSRALAVVETHFGDAEFGVGELADALGLSRRQLHRKLTASIDKTPIELIRQRRLAHAAKMLQQKTHNVSEVAYAVGFKKPRHFSALFKEAFGETPSDFVANQKERLRN